jgi:Pectate lyase superfamily protein
MFRYNAGSSVADNGGTIIAPTTGGGRWERVINEPYINVRWFGAKGDDTTDDTAAFQAAIAAAGTLKRKVYVPKQTSGSYILNGELTLDQIHMVGEAPNTVLYFNELGVNKYAITMLDASGGEWNRPGLENIFLFGPGGYTLGVAPCDMHGIRIGVDGDSARAVLSGVSVLGFNFGVIFDNDVGHIALRDCRIGACFHGVYIRRGNGDYYFDNSAIVGNTFSCVASPKNCGISGGLFNHTHFGFSPYAFYQSDTNETSPGSYQPGWLYACDFHVCGFEAIGNAAFLSEATVTAGNPAFSANSFTDCFGSFLNTYKITARNQNWWMDLPFTEGNKVFLGNGSWPFGASGMIRYQGPGGWYIQGESSSSATNTIPYLSGDTRFNVLDFADYNARTVTVSAGSTSATYTFDPVERSCAELIKPTAAPITNPGSVWWITTTTTSCTINLAAAAPGGGVTFNLHLLVRH